MIIDEILVIVNLKTETVGYMNLYEPGDIWIKIKGCKDCPPESQKRCCGRCGHLASFGCSWHIEKGDLTTGKPFVCVVRPLPNECMSFCQQEYQCIQGKYKGKIRRTSDVRDRLTDGSTISKSE